MSDSPLPGVNVAEHWDPEYRPLLVSDGDWMAALPVAEAPTRPGGLVGEVSRAVSDTVRALAAKAKVGKRAATSLPLPIWLGASVRWLGLRPPWRSAWPT